MSRILLTLWPLTGHLHPNLALASALARRGHEVAFYSGQKVRSTVEQAGHTFFAMAAESEHRVETIAINPNGILSAADNPLRQKRLWREWVLESVPDQVRDLEFVIGTWRPDMIVCDPTLWAPFLVLQELTHLPVAVFSLIPVCYLSGDKSPIIGFPMRPSTSVLGRGLAATLRALSGLARRDIRTRANAIRQDFGLPPLNCSVTDLAGRMTLYLVPGTRSFDYNRNDLPRSVHYVGPCLWNAGKEETAPEFVRQLPQGQPVIYASEGTVHHEPKLLRAVVEGLAGLPVQVIITTGTHRDPTTLDLGVHPLPANIHIRQWVSLGPLLPYLSGIVTVGGPSTLPAGLSAGLPTVIVPFCWDHPETALRLEASSAGIYIPPARCTPSRMRQAVEAILNDPLYRVNARRLATDFAAAGGAERAADLITANLTAGEEKRANGAAST